jgi:hypothetical protein
MGDENPHSITSPGDTRGQTLSGFEKAEGLADGLETQFQPINDPSVIEVLNVGMGACIYSAASEPQLNNPTEVPNVIRGL